MVKHRSSELPKAQAISTRRTSKRLKKVPEKHCQTQEDASYTSRENEDDTQPLTLLEQAGIFRTQNSKKWRKRLRSRNRRSLEMKGKYEFDPFLMEHNAKIIEKNKKRREMEKKKGLEERKVTLDIKYVHHDGNDCNSSSFRSRRLSSTLEEAESLLDLSNQKNPADRQSDIVSDLVVTVRCGLNMHNHFKEDEQLMERSYVKVVMLPDHEKWDTKQKTSRRCLTASGTTRWDHTFIFRGLSVEQLRHKYLIIAAYGINANKKLCLGQTILSGSNVRIKTKSQVRLPTQEEKQPLNDALVKPGSVVSAVMELAPEDSPYLSLGSRLKREILQVDDSKPLLRKVALRRNSPNHKRSNHTKNSTT